MKASEMLSLRVEAEEKVRPARTVEIARNAIRKGLDNDTIADLTGLSIAQIVQFRQE